MYKYYKTQELCEAQARKERKLGHQLASYSADKLAEKCQECNRHFVKAIGRGKPGICPVCEWQSAVKPIFLG